jgi:hypothetical protein
MRRIALLAGVAIASIAAGLAEFDSAFPASLDHPAIEYTARPVNDPVAKLNRKILEGTVHLNFESSYGYLRSTLEAVEPFRKAARRSSLLRSITGAIRVRPIGAASSMKCGMSHGASGLRMMRASRATLRPSTDRNLRGC